MRLLGIDYGAKRVGFALSDETSTIATPLLVFRNDSSLIPHVLALVKKHEISAVVLGASYNYQGEKNPIMKAIEAFQQKLMDATKLPVHLETEVLTSVQAARHETNRELRDASAAALILQSHLDRTKA
ncbi:MAG TPA: Holliday junction resolvase RuvX [Candidatus Paceibacterota bacterium]|jgi:putative Holliday junction resolvase